MQASNVACEGFFSEVLKENSQLENVFYEDPGNVIPLIKEVEEKPIPKDIYCKSSPYFKNLNKLPPFSRTEEEDIFRRYTHLQRKIDRYTARGDSKESLDPMEKELLGLRNEIVTRNLKFVVKLAKSFWMDGSQETFENLVSSGNLGLIRAVERFEISRGVRFLTYAANWIALEIRIELSNNTLIKVPVWWQKTVRKLQNVYAELVSEKNKQEISVKELAKKSKVPLRHVRKLADNNEFVKPTNFVNTQLELPFCEKTYVIDAPLDAEKLIVHQSAKKYVTSICDLLPEVERKVITQVFGLDGSEPQNLRQISNLMGNTGERVRQLKEKGLMSLREKIREARVTDESISSFGDVL